MLAYGIGIDIRNGSGEHSVGTRLLSVAEVTGLGWMLGTTFSVPWIYSLPSVVEVTGLRLISGMALASIPCLAYVRDSLDSGFWG